MKITPLQQYMILGFFAFGGVVVLFYQVMLKPINKEILALVETRNQKLKDLEEAKKIVAKYVEFKKRADSVQRELEWVQNRIPKSLDRSRLYEAVKSTHEKAGVFLTNLQFTNGVGVAGDYAESVVNLRFNADYKNLLRFLHQVSLSNLLMTVRDLSVVPTADATHPNVTLSAQLILSGIQAKQ